VTTPSKRKSRRLEIDAPHAKRLHTIRAIEDQSIVDELRQKGKSERETRTSGGESMGGAISKCGDTVDEVIDIYGHSPVAAATSSVLYSLQYGDGGGVGMIRLIQINCPLAKQIAMRTMTTFLMDLSSPMMKTSLLTLIRSPRMSIFDRHFQRTGHRRPSFRVGHSLRFSPITLNLSVLPYGVNTSRRGRSMWTMNVTSD
jgi:hypothetical protein